MIVVTFIDTKHPLQNVACVVVTEGTHKTVNVKGFP